MELASTLSSLYFVACSIATGACNEQRATDFVEFVQGMPVYSCQRYAQKHPLDENLLTTAKQEGYKVSLRCDVNTESKIAVTDATQEAYLTSCDPKQKCTTDKLAMFNGDGSDSETDYNRCTASEQDLAPVVIALRKKQGYTKFSYNCFAPVDTQ